MFTVIKSVKFLRFHQSDLFVINRTRRGVILHHGFQTFLRDLARVEHLLQVCVLLRSVTNSCVCRSHVLSKFSINNSVFRFVFVFVCVYVHVSCMLHT